MPHLARTQQNSARILALHAVNSTGHLYDPESVEFRILDPAGAQVFPASGLEDVTDYGVATGIFPAWDTGTNLGWAPGGSAAVGRWTIAWTFTDSDGTTVRTWSQTFDVSEAGTGLPFWTYASPTEIRDEGITTGMLSNARMVALIRRVQEYIERVCRQPFRPVAHTFRHDGDGGPTLFFSVPIVGIERVKPNYSTQILDPSAYRVYAMPALGDDAAWLPEDSRRNPRIRLVTEITRSLETGGIFGTARRVSGRFAHGTQPHEVKGVWGYLERDGQTPELIRHAALRLVLANTALIEVGGSPASSSASVGPVVSERTDRHEVRYADTSSATTGPTLGSALSTSREVEEILQMHRGPIVVGAPATTWSTTMGP